jgi:hypothetical protein
MLVDVCIGEIINKFSILEIKRSKILNSEKLSAINKEIESLQIAKEHIKPFPQCFWYSLLVHINTQIWDLTDKVKSLSYEVDSLEFSKISHKIFELNQQKFRLKNRFNKDTEGSLQKEKSYAEKVLYIKINDLESFYRRISIINKLSIEYDAIELITPFEKEVKKIFGSFPFSVKGSCYEETVDLNSFETVETIYDFPSIKYSIISYMGDVILHMSVCAEKFYDTGRKAEIYVGDGFRFPIEKAYSDGVQLFSSQIYVKSYNIHKGEEVDIDFNKSPGSPYMNTSSWHVIFKSIYNIEWGSHQWLHVPYDGRYSEYILIHSTPYRLHTRTNFQELKKTNPNEKYIFISYQQDEYEAFVNRTGCFDIPFHKINNLLELAIAINSCKLFMGNLSAPHALADALHKNRFTMLCGWVDDIRNIGMEHIWPMQKYLFEK